MMPLAILIQNLQTK
jgi:hypothetical protein